MERPVKGSASGRLGLTFSAAKTPPLIAEIHREKCLGQRHFIRCNSHCSTGHNLRYRPAGSDSQTPVVTEFRVSSFPVKPKVRL